VVSIPEGWQLCDGTNSTPDLRDRFVVGARQDSGGIAVTNVSGGLTKTGGEPYHTLTIDEMPVHSHGIKLVGNIRGGGSDSQPRWDGGAHSNIIQNAGGGQAHNNLPPYYALCFIMKMQ
jgi:microcystin-dependent protein